MKNQKTLENSDKFKVGSKNDNIPKGKFMFIGGKVGCVFLMVIVSITPEPIIGLREDAPNFHQDFGAMKKTKKAILNNRQRQNKKSDVEKAKDQIREIAARIDNEEEFVLPEDDMISTDDENDEELSSMAFLDGLSQSKQIEKLEKERKRRINNQGEEFEIEKRRFV